MKKFIFICLILISMTAHAETMYVSEVKITLRLGPGNHRKILAMLPPGESVQVLEEGEGWSKVRLMNGTEGWVLSRYLTSEEPVRTSSKESDEKYETLSNRITSLVEENTKLKEKIQRLSSGFGNDEKAFNDLSRAYETLKSGCADFLKLQAAYKKSLDQIAEQRKNNAKLKEQLRGFQKDEMIKWFLSGAGVLLGGIIIGFIAKGRRRRSSLM